MKRISHDNIIADGLNIERNKVAWQAIIDEWLVVAIVTILIEAEFIRSALILIVPAQLHWMKCVVVDIYSALREVGGVEVAIAVDKGTRQAGVA